MAREEIAEAQSVLREFGYDVHDHCRRAADALIRVGFFEEAGEVSRASQALLDVLSEIYGGDFLLTGRDVDD